MEFRRVLFRSKKQGGPEGCPGPPLLTELDQNRFALVMLETSSRQNHGDTSQAGSRTRQNHLNVILSRWQRVRIQFDHFVNAAGRSRSETGGSHGNASAEYIAVAGAVRSFAFVEVEWNRSRVCGRSVVRAIQRDNRRRSMHAQLKKNGGMPPSLHVEDCAGGSRR